MPARRLRKTNPIAHLSGSGAPAQVEAELMALEQNVSMTTSQAANLVSHGANTMLERHIDMRSRVDAANAASDDQVSPDR